MPNDFAYCPDGVQFENRHCNQLLLQWTGKSPQGVPMTIRGSSGQALLVIDDTGVKISRNGIEAPTDPWVPIGGAIVWTRPVEEIPPGWAICDGLNGTPDYRDRFLLGAGSIAAQGVTGGAATVNLEHTHTIADHFHTQPAHSHDVSINHNHAGFKTTADDSANLTAGDRDKIDTGGTGVLVSGGDHRHWIDLPDFTTANKTTTSDGAENTATSPTTPASSLSTTQSVMPPYVGTLWIRRQV